MAMVAIAMTSGAVVPSGAAVIAKANILRRLLLRAKATRLFRFLGVEDEEATVVTHLEGAVLVSASRQPAKGIR